MLRERLQGSHVTDRGCPHLRLRLWRETWPLPQEWRFLSPWRTVLLALHSLSRHLHPLRALVEGRSRDGATPGAGARCAVMRRLVEPTWPATKVSRDRKHACAVPLESNVVWWWWWSRRDVYDMSLTICHNSCAPNFGSHIPVDTVPGHALVCAGPKKVYPSRPTAGTCRCANTTTCTTVDELRHIIDNIAPVVAHNVHATTVQNSTSCNCGSSAVSSTSALENCRTCRLHV